MSDVYFTGAIAETSTTTSALTWMQLVAATNQRVRVHEFSYSFTGVSNTQQPIRCEVERQTGAGTSSALTLNKLNESDGETLQTTANQTFTGEPTIGAVILEEEVHPQTGVMWQAPYGKEIKIKGGNRLGFRVTSANSINGIVRCIGEE